LAAAVILAAILAVPHLAGAATKKKGAPAANVDASLQQARQAADEKRKTAAKLRAEIQKQETRERKTLAELDKRDRELAVRRAELKRYQDEIAMTSSQVTAMRRRKKLTGDSLAAALTRLRNDLRAWYQGDRDDSRVETALWCGNGEADRISLARMSHYDLQQRESRLDEYLSHLGGLKRVLGVKERELAVKRRERASFLQRVRLEKGQAELRLRETVEAAGRLDNLVEDLVRRASRARAQVWVPPLPIRGRLAWPLRGSILQRFGKHRHKVYNATVYSSGIEIGARIGTPVAAAAGGIVVFNDWMQGYGRVLILDHGNGLYTVYGHLQDVSVTAAQAVKQGAPLGTVGETSSLNTATLYFEIRHRGRAVDPERYLGKKGK